MASPALYWLKTIRLFTKGRINQFLSQTNFPAVLLLPHGESCSTYHFTYSTFSTGPYISVALAVYTGTPKRANSESYCFVALPSQ